MIPDALAGLRSLLHGRGDSVEASDRELSGWAPGAAWFAHKAPVMLVRPARFIHTFLSHVCETVGRGGLAGAKRKEDIRECMFQGWHTRKRATLGTLRRVGCCQVWAAHA